MIPGGNADSAVVSFAVQEALLVLVAATGLHVAAAPKFEPALTNCTVPVGPIAELLLEVTVAVNVTLPPEATLLALELTLVVVVACVMVTDNELLLAFEV